MTDEMFEAEMRHLRELQRERELFAAERDRRYSEVAMEREKAVKIKEAGDLAALQLARSIQTFKDEKANELREQINSERGSYATKEDLGRAMREVMATIKPLSDFVAANQGRAAGLNAGWGYLISAVGLLGAVIAIVIGTR